MSLKVSDLPEDHLGQQSARRHSSREVLAFSLLALLSVVVCLPENRVALDPEPHASFRLVLQWALLENVQFGRDLVFTYGPWGGHQRGLLPGNLARFVAISVVMGLGLAAGLMAVARLAFKSLLVRLSWSAGALVILLGSPSDTVYFAPSVILLILTSVSDKRSTVAEVALGLVLGVVALVKATFLITAALSVSASAASAVLTRRKIPLVLLAWVVSLSGFWVMAGQHVTGVPVFLGTWLEVNAAYSSGMSLYPGEGDHMHSIFLLGAAGFVLLFGVTEMNRDLLRGVITTTALSLIMILLFKSSFVRYDDGHVTIGPSVALFLVFIWLPFAGTRTVPLAPRMRAAVLISLGVTAWILMPATTVIRRIESHADAAARSRSELAAARKARPLPQVTGTIDSIPDDQQSLIAHGLRYAPRPVFQSYVAASPALIEMNRIHFAGGAPPDIVMFDLAPIDDRYYSHDDGALWPELIARYRPVAGSGLLERRQTDLRYQLRELDHRQWLMGKEYRLPMNEGLIWISGKIARTAKGAFYGTLFQNHPVRMSVRLSDGSSADFRIIPGVFEKGFLLSPAVRSTGDFFELVRSPASAAGRLPTVESITIHSEGCATAEYDCQFRLKMEELLFSPPAPIPEAGKLTRLRDVR